MNNNDDIEILDDLDDASKASSSTDQNIHHKEVVSPYSSKPSVTGMNANSPRIAPNDTFVKPKEVATPPSPSPNPSPAPVNQEVPSTPKDKGIRPVTLLILFVVILIAIFFLPYTEKVFKYFSSNNQDSVVQEVTVGKLICTLEHDDHNNSYQYEEIYSFRDKKVESLEHTVIIQGNADYLYERNSECQLLQDNVDPSMNVTVSCDLSRNQMVETQYFNLINFDSSLLSTAFIEAGGIYPNAKAGDSYRSVQRSLEMSGYECKVQ